MLRQLGTGQSLVDAIAQQGKLCQPKIAIRLAQFIFYRTRQLDCFRVGISSFIQAQLIEIQAPQAEQRIDNSEVIPAGAVGFQRGLEDFRVGTADADVAAGVELWSQLGRVGAREINPAAFDVFAAGANGEGPFTRGDLLRVSVRGGLAVDAEQSHTSFAEQQSKQGEHAEDAGGDPNPGRRFAHAAGTAHRAAGGEGVEVHRDLVDRQRARSAILVLQGESLPEF